MVAFFAISNFYQHFGYYRLKIRDLQPFFSFMIELDLIGLLLIGTLLLCLFIQLYFTFFVHLRLLKFPIENGDAAIALRPLSVVICARNEKARLEKYLPSVLAQDYPEFEVVVVNDRSWDGTADFLRELSAQYSQLKVVTVGEGEKFIAGKKFAVTMGIKAASHDWLVFTDADCEPASVHWLKGMNPPEENLEIKLGYSPYFKQRSLLNVFIRFETFFTAVNYLSFALKGMPYMGVGRNMAYRKSLFFKNKGFASHMHVMSGDDDLFVNQNATAANTTIVIHPDAQVWSEPKTFILDFLKQKKRHYGAGKLYKTRHRVVLTIQAIAQFFFYLVLAVAIAWPSSRYLALGVLGFSILMRSFVYPSLLKRLSYSELRWWFPLLDVLLALFLIFSSLLSVFVRKDGWK